MGGSVKGDFYEDELATEALRITSSAAFPMVLRSAIDLGLIDIIYGDGNCELLSVSDIIDKLPIKPVDLQEAASVLDRILRYLTTYSIFTYSEQKNGQNTERLYGAKPICKFFTKDKPDSPSLAPLHMIFHHEHHMNAWLQLKDGFLEGKVPFQRAHGMMNYELCSIDGTFNKLFNDGMESLATFVTTKLLRTYRGFEGVGVLVDVGGGTGIVASYVTEMYPDIKVICYDLPHVVASGACYPGVELVGGDMFESIPKGDAMFVKSVFLNWNDEHCLKILKNCFEALPRRGKVICVEPILDDLPSKTFQEIKADMDLLMLCLFKGGRGRTFKELQDLAVEAGFGCCRHACTTYYFHVLEFHKTQPDA